MKRVIKNRDNIEVRKGELISPVDDVDRSGYIPLDVQFARMQAAGEELSMYRYLQYNTDFELINQIDTMNINDASEELDKATKSKVRKNVDKVVLDDMLKDKLNQYRRYNNKQEELKALKEKQAQIDREKAIYDKAINDYKQAEFEKKLNEKS